MIRHSWSRSSVLLGLLVVAAAAPPAAADWLVTTDGERIETVGPWEVRGRLLVATLADGRKVSMRASTVDLPASDRLTAEMARAAEQEPAAEDQAGETAPRKKAAIVLTDADFTRRAPRPVMEEEGAGPEGEAGETAAGGSEPSLVVTSWEEATAPEGHVVLSGRLVNRSQAAAGSVSLRARVYDTEGVLLGEGTAALTSRSLGPGDQSGFRIELPDVQAFSAVKFEPESVDFVRTAEGAEEEPAP